MGDDIASDIRALLLKLDTTIGKLNVLVERKLSSEDHVREKARRAVDKLVGADAARAIKEKVSKKRARM